MIRKTMIVLLLLASVTTSVSAQEVNGWKLFAAVKFETKFIKKENQYFLSPVFDEKILSKVGTEVTITGYYMPFQMPKNAMILSFNPYSSCFFCGGAGPESVVEVILKTNAPKLRVDQVLNVRGKLKLNGSDVEHMNFILEDAEILPKDKSINK
ncbi:hypothetical protein BH10BAC4_BH10BAC4_18420 [soil metagenome]